MLDTQILRLPVEAIAPNPYQPRTDFAPEPLAELADSIRRHGILQPLTVRRTKTGWELVAGERRLRAAKLAEIYDDIAAMPDGFDTYVGERGTLLSGGQKQRISIARIFLKNPPVLILDEATSALDSVTEAKLQETFEKLSQGRTTIIIAHRLSTVRNADRIAVIENGRVAELGSHHELMEKNGAYAQLVRTQELQHG